LKRRNNGKTSAFGTDELGTDEQGINLGIATYKKMKTQSCDHPVTTGLKNVYQIITVDPLRSSHHQALPTNIPRRALEMHSLAASPSPRLFPVPPS
jgi:hypothetical protein